MTALTLIASELRAARQELEAANWIADERDRLRDKYADELREDRELMERIRWGAAGQGNNPDNPNL